MALEPEAWHPHAVSAESGKLNAGMNVPAEGRGGLVVSDRMYKVDSGKVISFCQHLEAKFRGIGKSVIVVAGNQLHSN